jgi:hypothetical protein
MSESQAAPGRDRIATEIGVNQNRGAHHRAMDESESESKSIQVARISYTPANLRLAHNGSLSVNLTVKTESDS